MLMVCILKSLAVYAKNIHFRDITIHDTTLVSRMQESEHVREEMMSVCGLYCHVTRMFYTHVFMY